MTLIKMTKNDAVNQVYNVTVGVRSTLNELYGMMKTLLSGNFAHVAAHVPDDVEFRRGDIRHPQADISRLAMLPGVVPTHCTNDGLGQRWTGRSIRARTEDRPMYFQ